MIKLRNISWILRSKSKINRMLLAEFSNVQENSGMKAKIVEESMGKYEEICAKEKERINNFDKKCTKKEYLNAQMTRYVFITFAVVANISNLQRFKEVLFAI